MSLGDVVINEHNNPYPHFWRLAVGRDSLAVLFTNSACANFVYHRGDWCDCFTLRNVLSYCLVTLKREF